MSKSVGCFLSKIKLHATKDTKRVSGYFQVAFEILKILKNCRRLVNLETRFLVNYANWFSLRFVGRPGCQRCERFVKLSSLTPTIIGISIELAKRVRNFEPNKFQVSA